MTTITREEVKAFIEQIESDLSNGWEAQIFELKLARIALAALEREHAEWSDKTFGDGRKAGGEQVPPVAEAERRRAAVAYQRAAGAGSASGNAKRSGWSNCQSAGA